jgi:hypothetical protein
MPVVDELVTLLGLEVAPGSKQAVGTITAGLDKITNVAKVAGVAITAVAASIAFMVGKFSQQGAEIARLSAVTGETTDAIQQYSFMADSAGISSQALIGDIKNLTKSMHSPIPGEFNQGLFMLGVSTRKASGELKTGGDVLLDLADKFQGMSHAKAVNLASKVGISEDTLVLLKQGRGAIQDYMEQAEAFTVPAEAIEANKKFQIQLSTVNRMFQYIGQTVAANLVPSFDKYLNRLTDFMLANKDWINLKINAVVEGVDKAFTSLWDTVTKVKDKIVEWLPDIKGLNVELLESENVANILIAVLGALGVAAAIVAMKYVIMIGAMIWSQAVLLVTTGAVGGLSAAMGLLMLKFILAAAAIAIVALVIEDVITYFRGGESVVGRFIDKIKELAKEFATNFPNIAKMAGVVWDILKQIGSWAFAEMIDAAKDAWEIMKSIGREAEFYMGIVLKIGEAIAGWFLGIPEKIEELKKSFTGMFSGIGNIVPDFLKRAFGIDKAGEKPVEKLAGAKSDLFDDKLSESVFTERNTAETNNLFNDTRNAETKTEKTDVTVNHYAKEVSTAQPINNYSTNNQSQATKTTTVNQYIQGGNSLEVAEESSRRFQMMDIYGGDLAPNTQ